MSLKKRFLSIQKAENLSNEEFFEALRIRPGYLERLHNTPRQPVSGNVYWCLNAYPQYLAYVMTGDTSLVPQTIPKIEDIEQPRKRELKRIFDKYHDIVLNGEDPISYSSLKLYEKLVIILLLDYRTGHEMADALGVTSAFFSTLITTKKTPDIQLIESVLKLYPQYLAFLMLEGISFPEQITVDSGVTEKSKDNNPASVYL